MAPLLNIPKVLEFLMNLLISPSSLLIVTMFFVSSIMLPFVLLTSTFLPISSSLSSLFFISLALLCLVGNRTQGVFPLSFGYGFHEAQSCLLLLFRRKQALI